MAAAKAALKEVLKTVPPSTHIGLLVFSARNLTNDWVYPLGPRNDEELMRAIDLPIPNHGTPLGAYIKRGADRLLEERARQFGYGSYRLLVVTDGEANDPEPNLVERFTPEVIARGIVMDVIGVGMKRTHTLATRVHSYRAANDPASLKRAIADVFAEVSSTTTDTAQQEAFAEIAPIPAEMVAAIVQTLATTGNQPIGERPRLTPPPARPSPAPSAGSPPPPQLPSRSTGTSLKVWILLPILAVGFFFILFLVVLLVVLSRIIKRTRK
jgi:hypothetical protein